MVDEINQANVSSKAGSKLWLWIVVGIIIILLVALIFLREVTKTAANDLEARVPYIQFEGTVISLSIDNSTNYSEGSQVTNAPNDIAIVVIDKIITSGGSYNFNWSSIGIEVGSNVTFGFTYTARPAEIITVVGNTVQQGNLVTHYVVPTNITFENGYFVFRVNGDSVTENTLPGLQVGSKFATEINLPIVSNYSELAIGNYEIIS